MVARNAAALAFHRLCVDSYFVVSQLRTSIMQQHKFYIFCWKHSTVVAA